MKKFYNLILVLSLPLALLLFSYSSGSPGGKTGSIGDNGNTCTDCHVATPQPQTDWITTDIPGVGFMPGETYTITATGIHEAVVMFGFELTAEDETGEKVGVFNITDVDRTKLANANKSVTHTSVGTTPTGDSNTWTMEWTAPNPAPEVVLFNAAFNAANGNGGTTGDVIYTTELSVSQQHVGLSDDILAQEINIYPNPADEFVNIDSPLGSAITIFDMSGRIVDNIENTNSEIKINLNTYNSGLYTILITNDGSVATKKLIVK